MGREGYRCLSTCSRGPALSAILGVNAPWSHPQEPGSPRKLPKGLGKGIRQDNDPHLKCSPPNPQRGP